MASTIASTAQQMSMSFGVAAASLITALFIPNRFHSDAAEMIRGVHRAFLLLGALTVASTIVFRRLRADDGNNVSRHKLALGAASEVATAEGPLHTPRTEQLATSGSSARERACALPGAEVESAAMFRIALLVGLCEIGCGGVAATSADPNPAGSGLPVSGFYTLSIDTATDCSPAPPVHETREDLVSTNADGLNLNIWSKARQDVPWTGLTSTFGGCNSSVRIQVTDKSSSSFSVQSDWLWVDPESCALGGSLRPSFACNARQFASYQLIEPCPASRNGLGCGA